MKPTSRPRFSLKNLILRRVWTGQFRGKACSHLDQVRVMEPAVHVCSDCVALGDTWPHLRMCLVCGYVGCCEQAKNKHSRRHFEQTGHPLMRSIEPGDRWMWCYVDQALLSLP